MERFSGLLGVGAYLLYLGIGLVQLVAIYSFFHDYWGWYWIFAAPAAFALGYLPIIGSICGFIAAHDIWDWEWWQALLLFCWPALVSLACMLSAIPMPFGRKKEQPTSTPVAALVQTIDVEPASIEQETQQNFTLEQNVNPSQPASATQDAHKGDAAVPVKSGFFYNLRMGNYSLARTFWLYGYLVFFLNEILIRIVLLPDLVFAIAKNYGYGGLVIYALFIIFELFIIFYGINVYLGVWRAAEKYRGWKIWKYLAKFAVILWWFGLIFGIFREVTTFLR